MVVTHRAFLLFSSEMLLFSLKFIDFEEITLSEKIIATKIKKKSNFLPPNRSFQKVIEEIQQEDKKVKQQYIHESQTDAAKGFGGSFGVQQDRVDKSAVGWDYHAELNKHESQKGSRTILVCSPVGMIRFQTRSRIQLQFH